MTSSGTATGANVDPGCPYCPRACEPPAYAATSGPAWPTHPSWGFRGVTRGLTQAGLQLGNPHLQPGKLTLQRLDQLVALREPLKQLLNRRRPGHRKIINTPDAKIKPTRGARGPDQLQSLFAAAYRAWRYVLLVPRLRLKTGRAPIKFMTQDLDERRLHVDTYVAIERNTCQR